jgi:hypothetical protein
MKILLCFISLVAACANISSAQIVATPKNAFPELKSLMTADEYKKAGLAKMTVSEVKAMNEWVEKYTASILAISQLNRQNVAVPGAKASAWSKAQVNPIVLVKKQEIGSEFIPLGSDDLASEKWKKEQVLPICLVKKKDIGTDFVQIYEDLFPPTWKIEEVKPFVFLILKKNSTEFEAIETMPLFLK